MTEPEVIVVSSPDEGRTQSVGCFEEYFLPNYETPEPAPTTPERHSESVHGDKDEIHRELYSLYDISLNRRVATPSPQSSRASWDSAISNDTSETQVRTS